MLNRELAGLIDKINQNRKIHGFFGIYDLFEFCGQTNLILDPFSILINPDVQIGMGNVFYPNVTIEVQNNGHISVGNNNIFHPATLLLANQGTISMGNNNELGDGGLRIKANMPSSAITIGNLGRYMNGPEIMGRCFLGSGSQILDAIIVQNCNLGAGESYSSLNPDSRGGLLKGFGLARNLEVTQGQVINGQGAFEQSAVKQQSFYHPKMSKMVTDQPVHG